MSQIVLQPTPVTDQEGIRLLYEFIRSQPLNYPEWSKKRKKSRCPNLEGEGHQQESKGKFWGVALDR